MMRLSAMVLSAALLVDLATLPVPAPEGSGAAAERRGGQGLTDTETKDRSPDDGQAAVRERNGEARRGQERSQHDGDVERGKGPDQHYSEAASEDTERK
jgi:hypothetical protein